MSNEQPDALQLADAVFQWHAVFNKYNLNTRCFADAATELRRQHAEIERLMKLTQRQAGEIGRLRERVFELEADPNSGDVIPLAEPRCARRTTDGLAGTTH